MHSPDEGPPAIRIRGARTHNLKNIDLDLPRDRLTVITGPSGSGKSSLAFDTLYAEGQRRYVESLSAYARQFLSVMEKPDVDHIEGLSPAISIEQKSTSHNPRSTVGTITEIHDYLRLLFARVGEPQCPDHGAVLRAQTVSQMVDTLLALPPETRVMLLAPVVAGRKGEHAQLLDGLRGRGYVRARIDGHLVELDQAPVLDGKRKHDVEVVVDRLRVRPDAQQRLADSFEAAVKLGEGIVRVAFLDEPQPELLFSARYACPQCGYSVADLEPRLFSFNNPAGACPECDGLGLAQFFDPQRIVSDPSLSLAAGAIPGWDRRNTYYLHILQSLARHYDFDLETPFEELPDLHQQAILFGSGEEEIVFTYATPSGRSKRKRHPFEGIVNNFSRRYRETDSSAVREHLARFLGNRPCVGCGGSRLRREARNVFVAGRNLPELVAVPVGQSITFFRELELPGARGTIAQKILREIESRLGFLVNVGLEYLTLARSADTLSGGEAQRIRLASQIGAGLVGVLYVLDEPSIGLHQRDNQRLLSTLTYLRDLGNTVIVIEHDEEAMQLADHIVDMGPGAGAHGGYIIAEGRPADIMANPASITGQYLSGRRAIALPTQRRQPDPERMLCIEGANGNNLCDITVSIPLGLMTCITGVSGSGKSTLINETLYKAVAQRLNHARDEPAPYQAIHGLDLIDKVVNIDQSPIGRTPRSNPATYTGLFTPIRDILSGTPEARARAYGPGRFSFNVAGGRCEACQGDGMLKVEMHFLADIYVPCDVCHGQRYNRETLEIEYKGRNIHQILDMTIEQAGEFFSAVPMVKRKLDTLSAVGLGYVRLGQAATTLSGGEAQRVKLSRELSKRDTGRTLYILDEPTTGLHFQDIELLLGVLTRLRNDGNTLVVVEHNLDVIKTADWVIDLGPEGGSGGGQLVACGTPEDLALEPRSHTGRFLAPLLRRQAAAQAGDRRRA
ncbi:MAG: excinuclease ABC subunit UvrA [Immundisolibacter sp.]|uniref:excinuclease ABC subunit UvrA n=1 Tax=Immundisolibacter sp. TaxID=1934948 RepID=UPI003EE04081